MNFTVLHYDKAKKGSSGGLSKHIDREQKSFSQNIDTDRTHLNFSLVEKNGSIDEMANQRIKQGYTGSKKVRSDAVTTCRFILSGSHEKMKELSRDEVKEWAYDSYKFFEQRHGKENIIRADVHLDEKTPHMHLVVVPLTENGILSAKQFYGDKQKMKELHTSYADEVGQKYGLVRGLEGKNRKHVTTQEYYKYVNQNELTAEKLLALGDKQIVGKLIELADTNQIGNLEHIAHKKQLNKLRENERLTERNRTKEERARAERQAGTGKENTDSRGVKQEARENTERQQPNRTEKPRDREINQSISRPKTNGNGFDFGM